MGSARLLSPPQTKHCLTTQVPWKQPTLVDQSRLSCVAVMSSSASRFQTSAPRLSPKAQPQGSARRLSPKAADGVATVVGLAGTVC